MVRARLGWRNRLWPLLTASVCAVLLPIPSEADKRSRKPVLSFQGVGDITIGMSAERLRHMGILEPQQKGTPLPACVDVVFFQETAMLGAQIQGGTIQRLDVISNSKAETREGIHLGSTEEQVRRVYVGRFRETAVSQFSVNTLGAREPGRGHAFLITSNDRKRAIEIETDGVQVNSMHVGVLEDFPLDKVDGVIWVIPCEALLGSARLPPPLFKRPALVARSPQ
jgi:hypothetical protein